MKKGFTLIELLVVVLIIGILSAIALPQYQKAVLKTRVTQGIIFAKALHDAQEVYYLANGAYPTNTDQLEVQFECPTGWLCNFYPGEVNVKYQKNNLAIAYIGDHFSDNVYKGVFYCVANQNDKQAVDVCKNLGVSWLHDDTTLRYRLN